MRGRRPQGPESVERAPGSEQAKQRARTVLETMTGSCRVVEACRRLKISAPRYHQLRTQGVDALVASMESGHAGRPTRRPAPEQEKIAVLQEEVAQLKVKLQAAQARAEIALVLPNVVQDEKQPEKKTRQRQTRQRRQQARRPPGRKNNTCNASSNCASNSRS